MAGVRTKRIERSRTVFLSWTTGNRRTADLATYLGVDAKFVCFGRQRPSTAPIRWLVQAVMSAPSLVSRRTTAIIVMLPPYPALILCRAVASLRRVPLVVDVHSAVIEDSRWRPFLSWTMKGLRRSDLTIVTNGRHRTLLEANGVNVTELHDPPAPLEPLDAVDPAGHVLVPASWHADEPIVAVVEMARERPDIVFAITGRPSVELETAIEPLPENVRLTGFVSDEEYGRILSSSSAVCCFTLNDNTMQRGGYEALAKGLPLVTSDFGVLREYFGDAAEYAEPAAESIGRAVDRLFADHAGHAKRMARRRREIADGYAAGLQPILDIIDERPAGRR